MSIILRRIILKQKIHTRIAIELSMQIYYFVFLFVQIFFMISIFFNAIAFMNDLTKNFKFIVVLLTQNLLKINNYFFLYILLQILSINVIIFLQITRLIVFDFEYVHDNISKKKWEKHKNVEINWEFFIFVYINLTIIDKNKLINIDIR